jgi:hypothetical protein
MPATTTRYLALFNGDPTSGTEITSSICNRVSLSSMETSSGGSRSSTNTSDIILTSSSWGSGTWTYIAAYDAASSGNLIWYKAINSQQITPGQLVKIASGDLTLTARFTVSDYTGDYLVNWMTGGSSMPATTTRYLALFNGDPADGGTEITTTIRPSGRVNLTAVMSAASAGSSVSNADLSLGIAAGSGLCSFLAIYDASVDGNLISYNTIIGGTQYIIAGYPVVVPAGYITITGS